MEQDRQSSQPPKTREPIRSWEAIERPRPFGDPLKKLRLQVTYADGTLRILPPSFRDREQLDKYLARFHEDFAGKEIVNGAPASPARSR